MLTALAIVYPCITDVGEAFAGKVYGKQGAEGNNWILPNRLYRSILWYINSWKNKFEKFWFNLV